MAVTRNQPIKDAPRKSRLALGRQLFRRREELGLGDSRPRFQLATGVNKRYADDLENARRDNFDEPFLRHAARGYAVTYESVISVAWGRADELAPALPPAAPARLLPSAPMDDPVRESAGRPYLIAIWERLLGLARRGVRDPDGRLPSSESWSPSGAQLGLSPGDAGVFDGSAGAMDLGDRVWLVADVQRGRDARNNGTPEAGAEGA